MPSPMLGPDELLAQLRTKGGDGELREFYVAANMHDWFVTYRGGQTTYEAVQELVQRGEIHDKYSTSRGQCYYIGRTIYMERSVFSKKNHRIVHVGDE